MIERERERESERARGERARERAQKKLKRSKDQKLKSSKEDSEEGLVIPISRSVPALMVAAAASSFVLRFNGGPIVLTTAPQSVVMYLRKARAEERIVKEYAHGLVKE